MSQSPSSSFRRGMEEEVAESDGFDADVPEREPNGRWPTKARIAMMIFVVAGLIFAVPRLLTNRRIESTWNSAVRAHNNGDYGEAAGHYERILNISGANRETKDLARGGIAEVLFLAGQDHEHKGDGAAAIASYERALDVSPKGSDGYPIRAYLLKQYVLARDTASARKLVDAARAEVKGNPKFKKEEADVETQIRNLERLEKQAKQKAAAADTANKK